MSEYLVQDGIRLRNYHRVYMHTYRGAEPPKKQRKARDDLMDPQVRAINKIWRDIRIRALKDGIEFTITTGDILAVWPKDDRCPIFGDLMVRATPTAPSVDRLDSDVGYIPDNICVVSFRANVVKSNGTAAEHRAIADWQDRMAARQMGSGD